MFKSVARLITLLVLLFSTTAQAATYAYRSDTFTYPAFNPTRVGNAATAVTWSGLCTNFTGGDDDYALVNFSGGFTFTFGTTAYAQVRILSNGLLQFGADTGFQRQYTDSALPFTTAPTNTGPGGACANVVPQNLMAVYWQDINTSPNVASAPVYYELIGTAPNRTFAVTWNNVALFGNAATRYTFQVLLNEDGTYKYQYISGSTTGSGASVGYQLTTTDSVSYSSNQAFIDTTNGTAITWYLSTNPPAALAEYRMEQASWNGTANEVADNSVNGYNGVRIGSANTALPSPLFNFCRAASIPSNSGVTAATQDAVSIPLRPQNFNTTANGGIMFWYRPTAAWNDGTAHMLFDATTVAGFPFFLMKNGANQLQLTVTDSAGTQRTQTTAALSYAANTWHHIAVGWFLRPGTNLTVLRIFVDGVSAGTVTTGLTTNGVYPTAGNAYSTLYFGDSRTLAVTPAGGSQNSANGLIDEIELYNFDIGLPQAVADFTAAARPCSALHHLEIQGSATGVTCTPSTLTIQACSDALVPCTAYTSGVTGTMSATGTPTVNWSGGTGFSIASGSSTITKSVQVTTAGSVVFGISAPSPVPSSVTTCNFGSPSCTFTSALAGFLVSAPNHVSCTNQTLTVRAVRQSDSSPICVPAFASTSKSTTISVTYTNPTTGTRVPVVGGSSISTAGVSVSLAFDATGTATPSLVYNDVGRVGITVAYVGSGGTETGLSMTGTASPIVAPASFSFSGITAAPITAGANFNATVTALNACSSPAATPNFGGELTPEGVSLSFTKTVPTGAGASNGSFSGSVGTFTAGSASGSNLNWSEVGQGTLTANLTSANYLGSGLSATGTSATVGRFRPAYFNTAVTVPGCSTFTYSGQPFTVTVTANKQGGGTTVNYSGAVGFGTSNAATLSDANGGTGTWANNVLATTDFVAGVGSKSTVSYSFASRQTAPTAIAIRAIESTGTDLTSSLGHTEGTTTIYSGRFRLANAYGSERLPLSILSQAEYYNGTGWAVNGADNCTVLPLPTLTPNPGGLSTTASYASSPLLNGVAGLSLTAPSGGTTGYVDLTVNVPSYLEFAWRSATVTDPVARATFGIYKGNDRLIYRRERY